jgi:ABC-type branched-subunit amino acid transport system substrate-binding protein
MSFYARFLGRRQAVVAAGAVLLLGLAGCSYRDGPRTTADRPQEPSVETKGAPAGSPVKVAILLPLSGERAAIGRSLQRAAEMAAAEAGAKNMQLIAFDTLGTPDGAAEAANKAIAADVKILLGPVFVNEVRAVKDRAASARLNVIAFSNDISVAGGNVFLLSYLPRQQLDNVIGHASKDGRKRIGVVAPDNDFGKQMAELAREVAPKHGAAVTRVGYYKPDTMEVTDDIKTFSGATGVDRRGRVGRAAPLDFDAVLIPEGGTKLRMVASLLAYYDVDPDKIRYLGTGRWDDRALQRETMLKGGWFAAPHPELWDKFAAKFRAAGGQDPPRIAALAHDAVTMAATIAKNPNGIDYGASTITSPQGYNGAVGAFRFTPDGFSERSLAIIEIQKDEFKIVAEPPKSFAAPGTN